VLVGSAYAAHAISFNGGNGWVPYFRTENERGLAALTGFHSGPLIEYGSSSCAIQFIEDGTRRCSGAPTSAQHVFAVNEALAYAVYDDRLLDYDGVNWRQLGAPLPPPGIARARAVWANQSSVFVVGDAGLLALFDNGVMKAIPRADAPNVDYVSAWGFGVNDLWAGSADGQLIHYDGKGWSPSLTGSGSCSPILGMWGDAGTLYFHTQSMIGVHRQGIVRQLMYWDCDEPVKIESLWGNSVNEVFVALHDPNATDCAAKLMWFDGASFSPL